MVPAYCEPGTSCQVTCLTAAAAAAADAAPPASFAPASWCQRRIRPSELVPAPWGGGYSKKEYFRNAVNLRGPSLLLDCSGWGSTCGFDLQYTLFSFFPSHHHLDSYGRHIIGALKSRQNDVFEVSDAMGPAYWECEQNLNNTSFAFNVCSFAARWHFPPGEAITTLRFVRLCVK